MGYESVNLEIAPVKTGLELAVKPGRFSDRPLERLAELCDAAAAGAAAGEVPVVHGADEALLVHAEERPQHGRVEMRAAVAQQLRQRFICLSAGYWTSRKAEVCREQRWPTRCCCLGGAQRIVIGVAVH